MIGSTTWRLRSAVSLAALACLASAAAFADPPPANYAQRADVRAFIDEMASERGFDAKALRRLFAQVEYQPKVIEAISRPVIAPPKWYEFAPRFLAPERVEAGVAFWRAHEAALARADQEFGVPPEIIVAIIGVETYYGRYPGTYRVLDALTTLAFDYPRRAEFFRKELKQFLLFAREEHIPPLEPRGSYAGAMGLPQFMPSSIRAYALDYDLDGKVDLAADADDTIGSVAYYLARHGWQRGQPLMSPALIEEDGKDAVLQRLDAGVSERASLAQWESQSVAVFDLPRDAAPDSAGLLMLEEEGGPSYWLVFDNWFVITSYNRSRLYASAVVQLAEALRDAARARAP
ncbi:MAG TPA: lytic murein transglycosylase B [Casimicrobiaceae bacterium]|nr:lytic murein transglycosylase B [Casimicrobiaceae bacterium]